MNSNLFRRFLAVLLLPIISMIVLAGCGSKSKIISIVVSPSMATIAPAATQQFKATATYGDGKTQDVTATATWTSGTTSVATISATGLATAVAAGTSGITAKMGAITSLPATLTVSPAPSLVSIAVTPTAASIGVGSTQQYTATGTYTSGPTQDITSQVTWTSATTTVATISASGLATAVAVGTSNITATLGAVTSPATGAVLTVTIALTSITVAPASATIPVGGTALFTATGHFSDGSTQTLANVNWASATGATASITGTGVAVGLAAGASGITASSGAITSAPASALTVVAAVPRAAYVSATGDGYTATYIVDPPTASLVPIASENFGNFPVQVIPEPSGRFAYLLEGDQIQTVTLDQVSGRFSGVVTNGTLPNAAANQGVVDPTGQYLYVASSTTTPSATTLQAYQINLSDDNPVKGLKAGALSQIGTGTTGFNNLYAVITDRTGKYLYAIDDGAGLIYAYGIGVGGVLAPLATPTYPTGTLPQNPAIDPTDTYLYVPNQTSNSITAYQINADGSLKPVAGQPFTVGVGTSPSYVAVEATGKFLFVTNLGDGTIGSLSIAASGALTAGTTYGTGASPFGIAIDPTNSSLAVSNLFGNSISMFTLATGVLTGAALPQVESPSGAYFISYGITTAATSVKPGIVYAANSVSGDISTFTSNSSTGVLTSTGAAQAGSTANSLAAADLSGSLLLTASATATQGGAFTINQSTGAISVLAGSPFNLAASDTASAVEMAPTAQFAYVLDQTTGSIIQYPVSTGSGTIGTGITTLAFVGASNLVIDPQGDFVYALGNNSTNGIQPFTTYLLNANALGLSTQSPALPGNWTSGSVDGSGQYLVAVNSTAKKMQVFTITPAGTGSGTDGALTPLGASTAVTGTGPWVLVFDPKDRAVFVADQGGATITPYAFNYATGTIGAAAPTASLANGITNLAIDSTANFLYAGQKASGVPGSAGKVAVYQIGAGGALTAVAGSPFTAGTGNPGVAASNVVQ